jgi:hypothetical protein
MKKLSTTKFSNLLRFTTFILIVSPSKVVYKIWISNLKNSIIVFLWQDDFKWKSCQLQSVITFWDYNFHFFYLSIRGRLKNSNFKFLEIQTLFFLTRWFQIKKLSTIKFHNFLGSTTFILVVSPSEVVYKIWISNLRNSNKVFLDKMISNQKIVNYKVS